MDMGRTKVRIKTYGCRMNVCDSEIIASILKGGGYDDVDEFSGGKVDVLILNCCSVREDGHVAAISLLHDVVSANPSTRVILCGCYSTLLDDKLFAEEPHISSIVRPEAYHELPDTITRILRGEARFVVGKHIGNDLYEDIHPVCLSAIPNRAVVVAKGCSQSCAYCIEPFTRGLERYLSPDTILRNVDSMLSRQSEAEITLVGHLIDRYHYGNVDFPALLGMAAERCARSNTTIKYISSHPATYTDAILNTVIAHKNILKIVHLPVQSGSDAVLLRMRRGYTADDFIRKVQHIRKRCPEMKIVTDIMVGFCGETYCDFEASVRLVERLRPYDVNVYKFSMRQHTFAYDHYVDDIDETVKQQRYNIIKSLKGR